MTPEQIEKLAKFKELRQAATNASFDCGEFDDDGAYEAYRTLALKANDLNEQVDKFVEELLAEHSLSAQDRVPDTSQDWAKLDGAQAFQLIERHANDWAETGNMMESWLAARMGAAAPSPAVALEPVGKMVCAKCGRDRFKEPCPNMADECPMIADAHLATTPSPSLAVRDVVEELQKEQPDYIRQLIELHTQELDQNDYAYFELARTRRTDWMAWICTNLRDDDPERHVLAKGQGDTPDEACAAAVADYKTRAAMREHP